MNVYCQQKQRIYLDVIGFLSVYFKWFVIGYGYISTKFRL